MRVMVDTNIFISALLFPHSVPAKALSQVIMEHELVLCEHILSELYEVIQRKCPDLLPALDALLDGLVYECFKPVQEVTTNIAMPDPKDQPILNAAIAGGVDAIISGDKHFLSLDLEYPKIMSASAFLQCCATER